MNFQYCIWLIPKKKSILYKLTHGFNPHISIQTHIKTQEVAIQTLKKLTRQNYEIQLDKYKISKIKGFVAFEYGIKFTQNKPEIVPSNPHISFIYKYNDENISEKEVNCVLTQLNKLNKNKFIFDDFLVMKCNNHYASWEEIKRHSIM